MRTTPTECAECQAVSATGYDGDPDRCTCPPETGWIYGHVTDVTGATGYPDRAVDWSKATSADNADA